MEFQGFEVMPLGNAQLSINESNNLLVSNIGESGLDGVMVKTKDRYNQHKVILSELSNISRANSFVKYTTLFKNFLGLPCTVCERFEWYEPSIGKVIVGYNNGLLPQRYNLVGYLNGETVFDIEVDKDNPPPPVQGIAWLPLLFKILSAAGSIAGLIGLGLQLYDRQEERTEDLSGPLYELREDGKCHRIGWMTFIDPTPFEVNVNNQTFTVDKVGLEFNHEFNPPLSAGEEIYLPKSHSIMVTAAHIDEFIIKGIEGS